MKNIPLPDLYYLENPDLKQLFRIMRISIFLLFFCLFSLMAETALPIYNSLPPDHSGTPRDVRDLIRDSEQHSVTKIGRAHV